MTTPLNYVARLKEQYPVPNFDWDSLPLGVRESFESDPGYSSPEVRASLNMDPAVRLFEELRRRLPPELEERIANGQLAVGCIDDPLPNAYCVPTASGGCAIILHRGLMHFTYRVARALSTRIAVEGDSSELRVPVEETARLLAEIFWWYENTEQAFGPTYEVTLQQIQYASVLAMHSERFVVAHELAHALLHLDGIARLDGHDGELAADETALRMVLASEPDAVAPRGAFELTFAYAGAEFWLQIYDCLERVGITFAGTHPPAAVRFEALREAARRLCTDQEEWSYLTSMARAFDELFRRTVGIISDHSAAGLAYSRDAEGLAAELHRLLGECVGGPVPDYSRFYSEADALFDRGYPHVIIEEVAQIARNFIQDSISIRNGEVADLGAWQNFQKYKLLLGYVSGRMIEPPRSVFMRYLDPRTIQS